MAKSPWKLLHLNPPAKIRLMARRTVKGKRVRAVSLQEIAIAAGMSLERAGEISRSMTWDSITIPEAERFIAGCNFDPLSPADRNRQSAYLRSCHKKKNQFTFLKNSPWWLSEFLPLIERLKQHQAALRRAS